MNAGLEFVTLPQSKVGGGRKTRTVGKAESWCKHTWRATVLYGRWQADSTQTRTTNIYSKGALSLDVCNSLRTLLININVRPICARGEKVGVGLGWVGWWRLPQIHRWSRGSGMGLDLKAALLLTCSPFGHERGVRKEMNGATQSKWAESGSISAPSLRTIGF